MANNFANIMNRFIPTSSVAQEIDNMMMMASTQRRSFEKRWYDNNFFDDGYHFRYVSRTTGKIVDQTDKGASNLPQRAIPKASRQIRGIANLLSGMDPTPVIYPEKVSKVNFPIPQEYAFANQLAKDIAQKVGHWINEEWKNQEMKEKMILMLILAAKHGVSFMQIWPDSVEQKINSAVFDAFDIYLLGNMYSIYDCPFIIKAGPERLSKMRVNESFDEGQRAKLTADNKYASSEIKQAYMQSRFGVGNQEKGSETIIQKEAFIKEFINDDNWAEIKEKSEKNGAMDGKSRGDMIIRHTFSGGGVWLLDEYLDLKDYPFVDFRYEPGPIYQTPIIERFIPANKSLDIAMSRIERWANTMVTGTWVTRKGEDLSITNLPGGQQLEYTTTPPVQGQMANVPSGIFEFMNRLERIIEEQGAATSALGQLPTGVKSGVAIESVKAIEYDNLKISGDMYKKSVKSATERMLDIADKYFIDPQTVHLLEKGEPAYFDIVGQRGLDVRKKAGIPMPQGAVPISGDYKVDIEVESGLGFTMEGKKETLQQMIAFFTPLIEQGLIGQESLRILVEKILETYQFGATQDLMDAMENDSNMAQMNEQQINQLKVAVAEVLQDLGIGGAEQEQKMVDTTKLGVAEAINDLQT